MTELKILTFAFNEFANLTVDDFNLSTSFWHTKRYKKGDYFNRKKTVCRYLGFIETGAFRSYISMIKQPKKKTFFYIPKINL